MFITHNFYPHSNNIAQTISSIPIEIIIWPITLIGLFIFIMPIWVTKSYELLLTTFGLSLLILTLQSLLLIGLYINNYWILWLITNLFSFVIISIIFIGILRKKI